MRGSAAASSEGGHRIRVVCRLRPSSNPSTIRVSQEESTLTIPTVRGTSEGFGTPVVDHSAEGLRFGLDRIYESGASQSELFEAEAAPLVVGCLEGVTGTLLAYGQTGAGKTYTVLGKGGTTSGASYDERGLVPRTLQRLFDAAARKRRAGASVEIRLSCIEVYNEALIDLLRPPPRGEGLDLGATAKGPDLVVWEDPKDGGVHVKHLEVAPAASAEEALHSAAQGCEGGQLQRLISRSVSTRFD